MSEQKQEEQQAEASPPVNPQPTEPAPNLKKQEPQKAKTTQREKPVVEVPPKPAQVAAPVQPRIRNRHDVAFRHDVFMSDAKDCLRNVSYEHLKPQLVKVPHKHVFHSHNNQGKALSRTGSAAGHWHNVEHYGDPNTGEILAKCGPAMHEVTIMTQTGRTVTRIEPVSFEEEKPNGDIVRHVDDHIHALDYLGSEELSPAGIAQDLKSQQAAARAMGITLGADNVVDQSPKPLTAADGVTMT